MNYSRSSNKVKRERLILVAIIIIALITSSLCLTSSTVFAEGEPNYTEVFTSSELGVDIEDSLDSYNAYSYDTFIAQDTVYKGKVYRFDIANSGPFALSYEVNYNDDGYYPRIFIMDGDNNQIGTVSYADAEIEEGDSTAHIALEGYYLEAGTYYLIVGVCEYTNDSGEVLGEATSVKSDNPKDKGDAKSQMKENTVINKNATLEEIEFVITYSINLAKGQGVYGKVTNQYNQPVEDAMVGVDVFFGSNSENYLYASAYTDSNGNYQLVLLDDVNYQVIASCDYYHAAYYPDENNTFLLGSEAWNNVNFQLKELPYISGTVRDIWGGIPNNISVYLDLYDHENQSWDLGMYNGEYYNGSFKVPYEQNGTYRLRLVQDSYYYDENLDQMVPIEKTYSNYISPSFTLNQSTGNLIMNPEMKFINKAVVSFDSKGGTAVDRILCNKNAAIGNLPSSTKKGYKFGGWYTDTGSKVTAGTVVTDDIVLTAKWLSNDASLKSLKVTSGKLKPKFKKTKYKYTATIKKGKKALKITPKKTNSKAKIMIKVGKGKYKKVKSIKVSLKKSKPKTVYIKVIAESGSSKVYKIKVKKAK